MVGSPWNHLGDIGFKLKLRRDSSGVERQMGSPQLAELQSMWVAFPPHPDLAYLACRCLES